MDWKHISTIVDYREPLGAVRTGESVRLSLAARPEEADESMDYEVALLMGGPDGSFREYKMEAQEPKDGNGLWGWAADGGSGELWDCSLGEDVSRQIVWSCTWAAPEESGVYWYYFRIQREDTLVFYGASMGKNVGEGVLIAGAPSCYQLTVYEKEFETPEWFRNSTMYQIFPDRFCRGDEQNLERGIAYHEAMGREVHAHRNWEEIPYYHPLTSKEFYYPGDFFGGDLEGIRKNLDYLKELGITCLYLNPIVEADSNHRYNTADYKRVDPVLGTNEDFRRLCREAEGKGIRILLDGVYSHTGADSIYFNKKCNYQEPGAYQETESPFDTWYQFEGDKEHYKSWWGFDTLPEVNEMDPAWQEFVITGKESVFAHWMENGAAGFRLDVADELPDEVIELMRAATKKAGRDDVLLGEVWEDATTKESYGKKRTYALGKGLDSVMNYPFRNMVIAWLTGWAQADMMADFLNAQRANYPEPMYFCLMNLISSHDVARIRTVLGTGTEGKEMERREQADFVMDHRMERRGDQLTRLAAALQFVLPGVPSIYYGDEYGMCGFGDPFNRGPFEKRDPEMLEYMKELSLLRSQEGLLREGNMSAKAYGDRILAILRIGEEGVILTVLNAGREETEAAVGLTDFAEGLTQGERTMLAELAESLVPEGKASAAAKAQGIAGDQSAMGAASKSPAAMGEAAAKAQAAAGGQRIPLNGVTVLAVAGAKRELPKLNCGSGILHMALKPYEMAVIKLPAADGEPLQEFHSGKWESILDTMASWAAVE